MLPLTNICFLCLTRYTKLKNVLTEDNDGILIQEKLKCILAELISFKPEIAKYVCKMCLGHLNTIYRFRQKWLQNMGTLQQLIQQPYPNSAIKREKYVPEEIQTKIVDQNMKNLEEQNEVLNAEKLVQTKNPIEEVVRNEDYHVLNAVYLPEHEDESCAMVKNEPEDVLENINIQQDGFDSYQEYESFENECSTSKTDVNPLAQKYFGEFGVMTATPAVTEKRVPKNTIKTHSFIYSKFKTFCSERNYVLLPSTPIETLAEILEDWARNMKKKNGDEYKEGVVKTMWNKTAKLIQEKYQNEYNTVFNPFRDKIFKKARDTRDAKRRHLRTIPSKRKSVSTFLDKRDFIAMMKVWDENTPSGLQKKFYQIFAHELGWNRIEAAKCLIKYFIEERDLNGHLIRLQYNPSSDTEIVSTKFINPNLDDPDICPIRIYQKMLSKRTKNIKIDRIFLTPVSNWDKNFPSKGWYKNFPVGSNEISKWMKMAAEKIGIDTSNNKITYRSIRQPIIEKL